MATTRGRRPLPRAVAALCLVQFMDQPACVPVWAYIPLALIPAAHNPWAVPLCAAGAGTGIGLSSVAATGLGTDVDARWRGGASGIINTAAQVGTGAPSARPATLWRVPAGRRDGCLPAAIRGCRPAAQSRRAKHER